MAIISVTEIPQANHVQPESFNYRGKIREDLECAWSNRIAKFEFVGYPSVATAGTVSREEAKKMFLHNCYYVVANEVKDTLCNELKSKLGKAIKYIKIDAPRSSEPYIKISGVTVNREKRLFGCIDWDQVDKIKEMMLDKYMKYYSNKEVIAELKYKLRREKQREQTKLR